ncbi:MAG: beta-propeller domain-containing protein [Deltaproteobacteria bacterium]|nr:beta-propeller domain-containing protein [Deltaproteobacteria bacterium]
MLRFLVPSLVLFTACVTIGPAEQREDGQEQFLSAAPNGTSPGGGGLSFAEGDTVATGTAAPNEAAKIGDAGASSSGAPRTIEETDLYRVDGDRLYYLNGYRGLMVFDISTIDNPRLIGRSPIFGTPIEMIVRNGVASVVVADWFGKMEDGEPFHGSIVRTLDATNPAAITLRGEAKLGGNVRDVRVVGDVMYAVSEDYGWHYGWLYGGAGDVAVSAGGYTNKVIISSVNIASGAVQKGSLSYEGYSGVFNVSTDAIILARSVATNTTKTELIYIDISDPAGAIHERGKIQVTGRVNGWSADNGRFNLDFYQDRYVRLLGCSADYCGGNNAGYVLQTVDFQDPASPMLVSTLNVQATGWSVAARFDGARLYLSPSDGYYGGLMAQGTPIKVFDLTNPLQPVLKGEATIDGNVWMFMPAGDKVFALGSDFDGVDYGRAVTVHYLDVSGDPTVLGTAAFGEGWTWTPAAGTFKAFTLNNTEGLVVLPFSGWSYQANSYNNGLQLIEFTGTGIATKGAAKTQGWVSRGVFAKGRLLSMSDTALSVVDYGNRVAPSVIKELVLARNVIDTVPHGDRVALVSSDWYDNDVSTTELRVLPSDNADESKSLEALAELQIDGTNARLFRNGDFAYVVTNVRKEVACNAAGGGGLAEPGYGSGAAKCYNWTQRATVVDLSQTTPVKRGSVDLPDYGGSGWYWGFFGCFAYDWYGGSDLTQVQGDAIAVRRWVPVYGNKGYETAKHALFIIDLSNPDAPTVGSTAVIQDTNDWWGNLKTVGDDLYATSWHWYTTRTVGGVQRWYVSYYLEKIDLSDRAHPKIGAHINVPGILVGGSEKDPSLLYTMDYRWLDDGVVNELAVVRVNGAKAKLLGTKQLDGASGSVFVRGETAYMSAQDYGWRAGKQQTAPTVKLYAVDLADPKAIAVHESAAKNGWGWLLGVEGDRAIVTSGWGQQGIDLYRLSDGADPVYDETVRTRGWWASSLHRDGDNLFISSGYWGAQLIPLD